MNSHGNIGWRSLVTGALLSAALAGVAQAREIYHPVPYQSQRVLACNPNYLCGYTAANMLAAYNGHTVPTADSLRRMAVSEKGEECPHSLSNMTNYMEAAQDVGGAPAAQVRYMTFDDLKNAVYAGSPAAVNLDYGALGGYRLAKWSGGHTVVVTGFSESRGEWFIHDPLGDVNGSGANRIIPSSVFREAVASLYRKAGGSGKYFEVLTMH